jgi:alkanesulfonate monooxygenase SsuD/methylene tetrahydromethanopterin reductase-like flavin-dependent oxidoreductase (luciferase family)
MQTAVGLDYTLKLSIPDMELVAREAARLGYESLWFGEGNGGNDGFILCGQCWAASRQAVAGGIPTGLSVTPVPLRTPLALAMSARTMSELTDGRFILGVGAGRAYSEEGRRALGQPKISSMELMRDYLLILRGLLNGEAVDYDGPAVKAVGERLLTRTPPRTPVYLGAVGPEMLRLGGELADGVCLSWNTPELIAWSRERIAEGAARAGRDPASVKLAAYVRMAVSDDADSARQVLAQSALGYALDRTGNRGSAPRVAYRAQFERMGFEDTLQALEERRAKGASIQELADDLPPEMVRQLGYYGPVAGAAKALAGLVQGLDVAIVRVIAVRPGLDQTLETLEACRPQPATG